MGPPCREWGRRRQRLSAGGAGSVPKVVKGTHAYLADKVLNLGLGFQGTGVLPLGVVDALVGLALDLGGQHGTPGGIKTRT